MYTHAPIRPCMCIFAISIYAHAHVHEPPMTCHMPPYNASRKTQGVFHFFLFKKSFYFVYCMWHCHSPGSMLATPFGRTPPHPPFGNCCLPTFPHWYPLSFVTWLFYERILAGDLFFVNFWRFRQECWERVFDIDKGMHMMEYLSKIYWIMWCFP